MFCEKIKKRLFSLIVFCEIFCVLHFFSSVSWADSIRLEIFCDGPLQPMDAQEWGSVLNSAGFQGVQIRGGNGSDVLDIRDSGADSYRVSGMLTKDNQLLLPGNARFSIRRAREIKPYLERQIAFLRENRTAESASSEMEIASGANSGLSYGSDGGAEQEFLFRDLAEPVGFRTKEVSRKKVIQKLAKSFQTEVRFPKSIRQMFDDSDFVTEELEKTSRGTAFVYVLRYLGYCLVPEKDENGRYFLQVVSAEKADPNRILPVGYSVENPTVSTLHERFQANVDGATVALVLDSLQKRLEIPFLFDFNSMAGLGIELEEVLVRQKPAKISYRQLLDAVLYQAQMKREVRTDEAGNIFFWMTTIRKAE